MTVKPGDIVTVDFPGITGTKRRPALVISSEEYHTIRPDVIIGLITSQTKGLGKTDHILQQWKEAGLKKPSVFRSFIITLPSTANLRKIGHVEAEDWKHICACLQISLVGIE